MTLPTDYATIATVIAVGGALGLFLLGMIIMTEGLRALAGETIRRALMRFTRTPTSGAITGAVSTAVLQSSSATTVAAVGFVGAGLMSFPNALGIIFGANIGTTITGWLVALIGFKLKLASLALPLVLCGALLRLFTRGRSADAGFAIAGFALIFVGIDALQASMRGLEGTISFAAMPAAGFAERLRLIALGAAFAVVTQSSSATVAAALTALATGLVDLPQGLCLVIGADIGTTATAALASIGASTEARRTGLSHVLYNVLTGALALLLIGPYLAVLSRWAPEHLAAESGFALVAFHTGFNLLGVLMILPLSGRFATFVTWLIRARADELFVGLERRLLDQPSLALAALGRVLDAAFARLLDILDQQLGDQRNDAERMLPRLQRLLDEAQDYLAEIRPPTTTNGEWASLLALIHALDHLQRLHERLEEPPLRRYTGAAGSDLHEVPRQLVAAIAALRTATANGRWGAVSVTAASAHTAIETLAAQFRTSITDAMARHEVDVESGSARLAAARWLEHVARHLARISFHLEAAARAQGR